MSALNQDMPLFSPALTKVRAELADFLEANSYSDLIEIGSDENKQVVLSKPWGEDALRIVVGSDDIIAALKDIILPERLSAIYHRGSRQLEIIWTAYKLPAGQEEIRSRSFTYSFCGEQHTCEFKSSSDVVLLIAKYARQITMSLTQFRNLTSSILVQDEDFVKDAGVPFGVPTSFFISNLDWDEETIISFCENLNFYIRYYDNESPVIAINTPVEGTSKPRRRYLAGSFPGNISGKSLDPVLVSFWEAAHEGDPARSFLYYYRIIEYASYLYLESDIRSSLKKALLSPHALNDLNAVVERIATVTQGAKMDDYARFAAVIRKM